MRIWWAWVALVALVVAACGGDGASSEAPTSTTPTTTTTLALSTTLAPTTTPSPAATTTRPVATTTTTAADLPIDDDWTPDTIVWGVTPACCDMPSIGSASPEVPIPADGWPSDGFYDVTVSRVSEPPGVLRVAIRRLVPCEQQPTLCPPDPPEDAIVADPATEIERWVLMGADLTVVIKPIQTWMEGQLPDPATGISGDGSALAELLLGWCAAPNANCGVDHAYNDWVWRPYQAGMSLNQIENEIVRRGADPSFPLGQFNDGHTDLPCGTAVSCPIAYRGPQETNLVINLHSLEDQPEHGPSGLYGWWTSLQISGGQPVLLIDAGQIAG